MAKKPEAEAKTEGEPNVAEVTGADGPTALSPEVEAAQIACGRAYDEMGIAQERAILAARVSSIGFQEAAMAAGFGPDRPLNLHAPSSRAVLCATMALLRVEIADEIMRASGYHRAREALGEAQESLNGLLAQP